MKFPRLNKPKMAFLMVNCMAQSHLDSVIWKNLPLFRYVEPLMIIPLPYQFRESADSLPRFQIPTE